jgi:hypothetical protein
VIVVGFVITAWNVVPALVRNLPGHLSSPSISLPSTSPPSTSPVSGPIVPDTVSFPPRTIDGQGYRYEINSVSRDRAKPDPGSSSIDSRPSLTIHGFVTRTEAKEITSMSYEVRTQDGVKLESLNGGRWEKNPTLGERLPIELRVYDSSPGATQLKITISDFFVPNSALILRGIPVPAG